MTQWGSGGLCYPPVLREWIPTAVSSIGHGMVVESPLGGEVGEAVRAVLHGLLHGPLVEDFPVGLPPGFHDLGEGNIRVDAQGFDVFHVPFVIRVVGLKEGI